ncbi:hypothetical protein EW146_g2358 [Bondarzewia mesenterica]|uniref:Uncharacterized protein n=1 Tax=Bondarzewia mesenterica TaxID=1095465 RepID=A0A4V3XFS3_9AGAM|nr:hypothetical protein EW146_g2358 [Bondarzewia mesenterica]
MSLTEQRGRAPNKKGSRLDKAVGGRLRQDGAEYKMQRGAAVSIIISPPAPVRFSCIAHEVIPYILAHTWRWPWWVFYASITTSSTHHLPYHLLHTASASPLSVLISTTEVTALRLGHPAAAAHHNMMNAAVQPEAGLRPTRIRHLCKSMQDGVTRFFGTFTMGRMPSLPSAVTIPVPLTNKHTDSEEPIFKPSGLSVDDDGMGGVLVKLQAEEMVNKDGRPLRQMFMMHHRMNQRGPFVQRVHRALMFLGPWEGRAVAFVLGCGIGVLLRMIYVLALVTVRAIHGSRDSNEPTDVLYPVVLIEDAEDIVVAPPQYTDEKVTAAAETQDTEETQARV